MKKVLALALGMLLIPFTAFGMETLSETDMDSITGQSGVAIAIDDVKLYTHEEDSELWYQTNAAPSTLGTVFGGANNAAIGLVWGANSYQMLHVNAIGAVNSAAANLYSPGRGLQGNYEGQDAGFNFGNYGGPNEDSAFKSAPLTITVSDDLQILGELAGQAVTGGLISDVAPIAGVAIGLPTVELFTEAGGRDVMSILVTIEDDPIGQRADDANTWSFGTLYTTDGNSTTALLGGSLEIAPLSAYSEAATP